MKALALWSAAAGAVLAVFLGSSMPSFADDGLPRPSHRPIEGAITAYFHAPYPDWQHGHRGVDIASHAGVQVRAAAAGRVSFAGMLAGRGVVVVDHGSVRTTYEPVTASVTVGTRVSVGDVVGTLDRGHEGSGCRDACLHWGLKRGDIYLDPLLLESKPEIRLVSDDYTPPTPLQPSLPSEPTFHGFIRPGGPITSSFGPRFNPLWGTTEFHDGTDFGLPCGAANPAVAAGTVIFAGWQTGLGNTIVIDHGVVDGRHLTSTYGHASALSVAVGDVVQAGQEVSKVGSTGWSTGCHLHLMIASDGTAVDPLSVL